MNRFCCVSVIVYKHVWSCAIPLRVYLSELCLAVEVVRSLSPVQEPSIFVCSATCC